LDDGGDGGLGGCAGGGGGDGEEDERRRRRRRRGRRRVTVKEGKEASGRPKQALQTSPFSSSSPPLAGREAGGADRRPANDALAAAANLLLLPAPVGRRDEGREPTNRKEGLMITEEPLPATLVFIHARQLSQKGVYLFHLCQKCKFETN
jgi:hypothetical protein